MNNLLFESSRGASTPVSLSEAMQTGLAPDGGLYMPASMPGAQMPSPGARSLPDVARAALQGFFQGDALAPQLGAIADAALNFPAPTTEVVGARDQLFALELFHGPTAAFKDFGARFLAESMQRIEKPAAAPLTILVATSGDTGGAVAAAFHRRPWVRVVILYPKGLVSPRQEQQLTCWGDNVSALRVDGSFDDCQRLVKEAFRDAELSRRHRFSSANSINIGRLLPQSVYYAAASLDLLARTGMRAGRIHYSRGQSGQRLRGRVGARARISHRSHHSGAQHQSHRAGLSANRSLAAARQHPDAGLRHGCRKSLQYGAPAGVLLDA